MADVKITTNREIERRLVRIRERIADNLKNRLVCRTLSCLHCYRLGKQDYSVVRSSITSHYKSTDHRFFNKENKVQVCLCARYFWANGPLDDLFFLKHVFDCLLQRPLPLGIQTLIRQAKSIIFVVNSTNKCDRRNLFLDETPFPKPPKSHKKECRPLSEFQLQPFQQPFGELRKKNHASPVDTDRGETSAAAADSRGDREQASGADGPPVSDGNAASGTAGTSSSANTFDQSEIRDDTTAGGGGDANDNAVDNVITNSVEHCEATTFENVFEQNDNEGLIASSDESESKRGKRGEVKSRLRNSIFFKMLTKVLNKNHFTNLDLLKLNLLKRKYNNEKLKQRTLLYVEERHVYRHFSRFFCNYVKTKNCKSTILCVLCKPPTEVSVLHFMAHNMHHMRLCANQEMRCCCKCGSYFFMHTDSNYCPNYLEHICKCVTGETFLNDEYFLEHFLRRNVVNREIELLKGELKERTREVETLRAENDLLRYDNEELKREMEETRMREKRSVHNDDHLMANMLLDMSASGSCSTCTPECTSTTLLSAGGCSANGDIPLSNNECNECTSVIPSKRCVTADGCTSPMPRETLLDMSTCSIRGEIAAAMSAMPREARGETMIAAAMQVRGEEMIAPAMTAMPREVRGEDHTMIAPAMTAMPREVRGETITMPVRGEDRTMIRGETITMPAIPREVHGDDRTMIAAMPREVHGDDRTMIAAIPREARDDRTMIAMPAMPREVGNTLLDMSVRNEANTLLDMSVRNEEDHTMANTLLDMSVSGPRDVRVEDHAMANTLLDMSTGGRREMVTASDVTRFERELDMFNYDSYSAAAGYCPASTSGAGYCPASTSNAVDYAPPPMPLMYEVADEKPEAALRHRSFFAPFSRAPGTSRYQLQAHTPTVRSIQYIKQSDFPTLPYLSTKSTSSSASKSKSDAFATLSVLSELLSPIPLSSSSSSSSLSSSMPVSLPLSEVRTGTKRKAEDNQGTKLVKKNK